MVNYTTEVEKVKFREKLSRLKGLREQQGLLRSRPNQGENYGHSLPCRVTVVSNGIGLYHQIAFAICRALIWFYVTRLLHPVVSEPSLEASKAWMLIGPWAFQQFTRFKERNAKFHARA